MNLSVLADSKFGWLFVWTEIVLIYLAFLWFQRKVKKRRAEKSRPKK